MPAWDGAPRPAWRCAPSTGTSSAGSGSSCSRLSISTDSSMQIAVRRVLPLLVALVSAGAVAAPDALAQGCAMCGTAFAHDDPVTRAFSWSVLFLIAMPYTVFGLAAGWLFLAHRRRRGDRRGEVVALPRTRPVPATAGPKER